jgi:6-pyruvoyltetrahydropterin/6-carboxytetrahydropterin synthase
MTESIAHLTVAAEYDAAHTLWQSAFSREENYRAFGECANPAGHGHRFRVELTFCARVSAERPYVIRRDSIRSVFEDLVAPRIDRTNLNEAFGPEAFLPTGENLARAIWQTVEGALGDDVSLARVRVVETRKNSFSYAGGRSPAFISAVD